MGLERTTSHPPIVVEGLVARYGDQTVLDGVDFVAEKGQITVVIGGSGCGKSTLMRHALGLHEPAAGCIHLFGHDIAQATEKQLKQIRIRIGVLFQSGALFTSMTVGNNVAMVIRENMDLPEEIIEQMVMTKLSLVGLEDAIHKYPEQLSGGMRKRAALARAMAADPDILCCDEPSAGLDPVVASELDELLLILKDLFDMTMVVVTHEIGSIKKIADRVVMLDDGHIIASGTLEEIMRNPDQRVQDFFKRVPRTEKRPSMNFIQISTKEIR